MPTGYTAGIIDGEIKTFKQFATLCMRAFGATLHMRDDGLDKVYEPRVPSKYYEDNIAKAKTMLQQANTLPDEAIIQSRYEELEKEKQRLLDHIAKSKENLKSLNSILAEVNSYSPPTFEHTGIKDFMIQQINETIKFDCDTSYCKNKISEIDIELSVTDAAKIRKVLIDKTNKDLYFYTAENAKELQRCAQANKWVEEFLQSLEPKTMPI